MEGGGCTGAYASTWTNTDEKILCDFRQGKGEYFVARSPIQGGTRTYVILRCLHNITLHDRYIIWLSIYTMKRILRALG